MVQIIYATFFNFLSLIAKFLNFSKCGVCCFNYFILLIRLSQTFVCHFQKKMSQNVASRGADSRAIFTDEFKVAFAECFNDYKEGRFKAMYVNGSTTSSLARSGEWEGFRAYVNDRCGTDFTKQQLQNLVKSMSRKEKAANRDPLVIAARNYARGTGGGPAEPDPPVLDGDRVDMSNLLRLPGSVPARTEHSVVSLADGIVHR